MAIKKTENNISCSIIIPTLNEAENIELLVSRLIEVINSEEFEIIFVDDSDDTKTREILKKVSEDDIRIKVIFRNNDKGLSSAVIDGLKLATHDYILVMDADLQHDERIIPKMMQILKSDPRLDLVIGSRYVEGGDIQSWNIIRYTLSTVGSALSKILINNNLNDPLSGFFLIKKEQFKSVSPLLMRKGFKILLDIFISSNRKLNYQEVPYSFRTRHSGKSKLSFNVFAAFYLLFVKKVLKTST